MPYLALVSLHAAAATVFVIGLLAAGIMLAHAGPDTAGPKLWRAVRGWHRWVTGPALILVWGLGLTLAITAGWFAAGWLHAKLVLVLILSGIHGMQSANLRRLAAGTQDVAKARARARILLPLIVLIAVGIVALVITKPF
ncbi:MAG: CopD family protein [Azospirillaceae bacterium]|nr:CopD family protein [Azospirillaceae bacterium]